MIRDHVARKYSGKWGDVVEQTMKDYGFIKLEQICTREPVWAQSASGNTHHHGSMIISHPAASWVAAKIADNYNDGYDRATEHCLSLLKNESISREELIQLLEDTLRMG